ncbi:hypothetical protein AB0D08_02825 [Kitasatospora sp. NPDC048540]|uniref:hypothetical protein n=1 Tax=unclassified Kitasatospora TaxID=2633591 RepID=UPI00053B0AE5|nr:hypothetical protein [Kitasatospora sp. MBT63]
MSISSTTGGAGGENGEIARPDGNDGANRSLEAAVADMLRTPRHRAALAAVVAREQDGRRPGFRCACECCAERRERSRARRTLTISGAQLVLGCLVLVLGAIGLDQVVHHGPQAGVYGVFAGLAVSVIGLLHTMRPKKSA